MVSAGLGGLGDLHPTSAGLQNSWICLAEKDELKHLSRSFPKLFCWFYDKTHMRLQQQIHLR